MKKLFWMISVVLLFVALRAPSAHADLVEGTIDFTLSPTGGGPDPTGSFVYDSTTGDLVSLSLSWDGEDYSADFLEIFSGEFVSAIGTSGGWCADADDADPLDHCGPGSSNLFGFLGPTEMVVSDGANNFTDDKAHAYGSYTVSTVDEGGGGSGVPTPEPSSLLLILVGIGAVAATRKCAARPGVGPLERIAR